MTRAQDEVLRGLAGRDEFLSAQDIHAALRGSGSRVGLTSVYRALQALTDQGVVDAVHNARGEVVYRHCASESHHHHLRCVRCGSTVEVEAPALEQWVSEIARTHGYAVTGHTVEVTGTCRRCTPK